MSTKRDKKEEEKKRRQNAEKPIGQNKKLAENEQLSRTSASSRMSTPNYTRYYNPEPNDQLSRETGLSVKAQKSTPTPALNLFDNSVPIFSDFTDRFNEDSILSVKNKETPVIEENEQLSRTEEKKEKNATSSKNSQTGENGKSSLFDFSSNGFGSSSRIGNDLVVNNKDTIIANPNYEPQNEPRQLSRLSTNGSGSGQTDRTMRDELNAAITVGNRSLSKYEELDAETQYKYGSKDYKKYLPGYKSALEKLDDCKLDYLVNKEFIEELYRQYVPSVSDRTNETAADQRSLEAQLKQMQSKLDAYLRRTDNMPDLRIYASYLEDIAELNSLLTNSEQKTASTKGEFDTTNGKGYSSINQDALLNDNKPDADAGIDDVPNESSSRKTEDISEKLDSFMEENAQKLRDYCDKYGRTQAMLYFYDNVKDGGDLDIKLKDDWMFEDDVDYYYHGTKLRYDDPGNINYGYVGSELFGKNILCLGAGVNQIGKYGLQFGSIKTFYDDERDNAMIKSGYDLSKDGVWQYEEPYE